MRKNTHIFMLIMNAIQYYIIDIFIKKPVSQYVVDDTIGDAVTEHTTRPDQQEEPPGGEHHHL
jgi:FixJ family two-component response regulator